MRRLRLAWLLLVGGLAVGLSTSCASHVPGVASTNAPTDAAAPPPPRNVQAMRALILPDGELFLDGREPATVECASVEPRVCQERAQAALAVDERRAFAMVHQACLRGFQPSCAEIRGPTSIEPRVPQYTDVARQKGVEGTVRVSCTLPAAVGMPAGCQVLHSIPELDLAVLVFLSQTHFQPVTFFGRPVQTVYVFQFKFALTE